MKPDGAFYLCVKTGVADDTAFAHTLLEQRDVIAIPAGIFGEEMQGWLRTSFVGAAESVREGYTRIAAQIGETGM